MEVLNLSPQDLILNDQKEISTDEENKLMQILDRLKQSEPMQYVLGYSWFCDLKLKVNKYVLIPRPETEELVEWIVKENELDYPSILDIGTGSGCIAIALAKKIISARVSGMDISHDALEIAKKKC